MTEQEWLTAAADQLTMAGCEDAAFDARCLLEDIGGMGRGHLPGERILPADRLNALNTVLIERAGGRPLQYILGNWDFLSLTLRVGEGVLIPRPDTEVLCETAAERLADVPAPRVLDLCAGSGCVGLGIASLCPRVQVTAVELSDDALPYLRDNIAAYPALQVTAVQADILTDADHFPESYDAILANPPYIPTADLAALSREVHCEPVMALDGDADGLRFYRAIADNWCPKLADGGFCAVEVGIGQAEEVGALLAAAGLRDIHIIPDAAGIARVVVGVRKKISNKCSFFSCNLPTDGV